MINVSIFSPHEDKFDFTNRNIIYSQYSKKKKINTTLYVSNFNYKTKKHKKLKNYFYESEVHKKILIYRIYSTRFHGNGLTRFFSYLTFAFISTIVFYFLDKKKYDFIIGETVPPICSLAAYLCSKKNNSKFIYQVRDPWPTSLVYNGVMKRNSIVFFIFESINKFLISKSNLIISVLPFLESFIRRKYNFKNNFYYLPNGSEVNKINVSKLTQGTDFIASITVSNLKHEYVNDIALTEIFPSGWDIVNTRFTDFGGSATTTKFIDIRDDRVNFYFDLAKQQSKTFEVTLNASYLGKYYLYGIQAEAMYDNDYFVRTKGQWIEVIK